MRRSATILLATIACAWLAPAQAFESSWVAAAQSEGRLLADRRAGAPIRAGVEINLKAGWKTYWRYPGDAGVPPRFDWSGSENLAAAEVSWPAPERFVDEGGAKSIGYHDNLVFPVIIRPADPAKPVILKLKLDFAVCEKLCIPADLELALQIPAGKSDALAALDRAERRIPRRAALGKNVDGLAITQVKLERGARPQATVEVSAQGEVDLFAEGPDERWALPLPERIAGKDGKARFRLVIDGAPSGGPVVPAKLVLTLVARDGAIEVETPLD